MKRNPIIFVILIFALVSLGCGIQFNVPVVDVKTGPTVTDDISIPVPGDSSQPADVTLEFGAGTINLDSGAESALISGTATYNVADFKPEVTVNGNNIRLEQGDLEIGGIPDFNKNIKNVWDLRLGDSPMDLTIKAGGYAASYSLGDLSLHSLEVGDGAAEVDLSFDEPNRVEMDTFRYTTGASNIELTGLANANADSIFFQGGAGTYTLDFTGELKRDVTVRIETGFSTLTISVPQGVSAVLEIEGGLMNVDSRGDWEKSGDGYAHPGTGPAIKFSVKMGAGTLKLDD